MNIVINRTLVKGEVTEGQLFIDDIYICDTLENSASCLVQGSYPISLVKCKQYSRKMICISETQPINATHVKTPCDNCHLLEYVGNNTRMPLHCPQIKPGNGICRRTDGSIIVGKRRSLGCIIHPQEAFETLFSRIRMSLKRSHSVTLTINDL